MYRSTKLNFYLYFYLSPYLRLYLILLSLFLYLMYDDSNQFTVYTEAGMHSRRGAAIFFRGASGRRLVPLAEELYQSRDSALRERDTLSDKLCTHRVSRKVESPGKYDKNLAEPAIMMIVFDHQKSERGHPRSRTPRLQTRKDQGQEYRLDRLRGRPQEIS